MGNQPTVVDAATAGVLTAATPPPPAGLVAAATRAAAERNSQHIRRRQRMRTAIIGCAAACAVAALTVATSREDAQAAPLLRALDRRDNAKTYRAMLKREYFGIGIPVRETHIYFANGVTHESSGGGDYTVQEAATGKRIRISRTDKTHAVTVMPAAPESQHAATSRAVRKQAAAGNYENLGVRPVGGRLLHGYLFKSAIKIGDVPITEVTYWWEPKSDTLVRTDAIFRTVSKIDRDGNRLPHDAEEFHVQFFDSYWRHDTLEYLGFDEDLDPRLFDMRVPEGYFEKKPELPPTPVPPALAPPKRAEREPLPPSKE